MLPLASSANAKITANRLLPVGRGRDQVDHIAFPVRMALLGDLNVYHIARNDHGNENDPVFITDNRFPFGTDRLNR